MTQHFSPTRAAALSRMAAFIPSMGGAYALGRNTDMGPGAVQAVSMLSPYVRRRLLTEAELVKAARAAHGDLSERFVPQVVWRTYFKGYLEQHPSIWAAYHSGLRHGQNRLATEGGLRRVYHDACEGGVGIDGFDNWARELVATGWLHNHARMWFASIWIFTLRLPWELGAAFFLRHLLDGDPAANTLSWRWVAGLHTKGKHYVARADNIARFTNGRFDPRGQLDEAPTPLVEMIEHAQVALPTADAPIIGPYALLLHDDDLAASGFEAAQQVALVSTASGDAKVVDFAHGALADTQARLGRGVILAPDQVAAWVAAQSLPVIAPHAPVGPNADLLRNLAVTQRRGPWDSTIWPHATRGFFQLKQRLPTLLAAMA